MLLMHARTEGIVIAALANAPPPNPQEIRARIGTQIAGVVSSAGIPAVRTFAPSLPAQRARVVPVPGLLALVVGWLAVRSRVTGVHLSILTQAMTPALALHLFRCDPVLRGNNAPRACRTSPASMRSGRTGSRAGSSRPQPWPLRSARCSAPGLSEEARHRGPRRRGTGAVPRGILSRAARAPSSPRRP
jgi:hypothetical protein